MKRLVMLVVLLILAMSSGHILAQDIGGHTESLLITWPPPVTEVWGVGDVLGTANIPNMNYYYLEYKPLNDDLSQPENAPWLPGTIAITTPIINGVLGTLDTRLVADGLYALRLTVSVGPQAESYHYVVSPIRVDNARFQAVEARIRAEAAQAAPTPAPTAAPVDNTPRVTPSATAVNVRRCDLIDNDRCPIIVQLAPGSFANIIGRNATNTFYQIRLASGVTGWASRTVVLEAGNVSNVPIVNPPAPLPAPVQPILPPVVTSSSSVVPNGMSLQGAAVCNQTFNVQINLTNTGNTVSSGGSLTVQDTNISTGTVTFSGSAGYPAINPGANFVVVVPVTTSTYYGEQHQLRAFTNNRDFTITYTLAQGNCAAAATPVPPSSGQRSFAPGECTLVISSAGVSTAPDGQVTFVIDQTGNYPAAQVLLTGGVQWYQISFADSAVWVPSMNVTSFQGNCN